MQVRRRPSQNAIPLARALHFSRVNNELLCSSSCSSNNNDTLSTLSSRSTYTLSSSSNNSFSNPPPLQQCKPQVKAPTIHHSRALEKLREAKMPPPMSDGFNQPQRNRFGWPSTPRANATVPRAPKNDNATSGLTPQRASDEPGVSSPPPKPTRDIPRPMPLKSHAPSLGALAEGIASSDLDSRPKQLSDGDRGLARQKRPAILPKVGESTPESSVHPRSPTVLATSPYMSPPHMTTTTATSAQAWSPARPSPLPRNRRSTLSLSPRRTNTSTQSGHGEASSEANGGDKDRRTRNINFSPRVRLLNPFNAHSPVTTTTSATTTPTKLQRPRFLYHCANVLCGNRETRKHIFPLCARCDTRYCSQLCAHVDRYAHKGVCADAEAQKWRREDEPSPMRGDRDRSHSRSWLESPLSASGRSRSWLAEEERRLEPEDTAPPADKYNISSKMKSQKFLSEVNFRLHEEESKLKE